MKAFVAITFTALLLLVTWNKLVVVMTYEVNKAYVANVLCENKDRPQLQCNGHCVLSKKLQSAEQQEDDVPPITFNTKVDVPIWIVIADDHHRSVQEGLPFQISRPWHLRDRLSTTDIFRPPQV